MKRRHTIACSLSNLKGVRDFIRESISEQVTNNITSEDVVLALDEMCSNLMIHAHQCNPDHTIELMLDTTNPNCLVVEITDDGNAFDINAFREPELNNLVNEKRKGGLGIRLVKSIMDSIEYFERNGAKVCRLTKKIQ
ncbi:MAG: ATP-binding protein [Bacteroidetes bacterium]|nr:ATP-binding protein [Bacteroidota bacterium]